MITNILSQHNPKVSNPSSNKFKQTSKKLLRQQVPIIEISEDGESNITAASSTKSASRRQSVQSFPIPQPSLFSTPSTPKPPAFLEFSRHRNQQKNRTPLKFYETKRYERSSADSSPNVQCILPVESKFSLLGTPSEHKVTIKFQKKRYKWKYFRTLFEESEKLSSPKLLRDLKEMRKSVPEKQNQQSNVSMLLEMNQNIANLKRLLRNAN